MDPLLANHFLSLPRPDPFASSTDVPDTTTLAAHDFDVDNRTGFMPPHPPLARLPSEWEPWEVALEQAIALRLRLGSTPNLPQHEMEKSQSWRDSVRNLPVLTIDELKKSELTLRRAHHVLAWTTHFYVHSLPPSSPISIPPPITLPLLQVSSQLQLPPVITYSDDVLYNWTFKSAPSDPFTAIPTIDNLSCQTLFTGTRDEEEFYLTSARMELKGVQALELMRATMDELFVGDDIAERRITGYLHSLAGIIDELKAMLMNVKEGCDPDVFYNAVRPWFCGADSDPSGRKWEFEGIERDPSLSYPTELSGPSAGQSSLVHSLDVFLGVDKYSHDNSLTGSSSPSARNEKPSFLQRMQSYMPRHHRNFLLHLSQNPRPLRDLIFSSASSNPQLQEAYNSAVGALKKFRDSHMIIVALYIIAPARRRDARLELESGEEEKEKEPLKGTGGSDLVKFLKGVRDQTAGALISPGTPPT